MSWFSFIKLQMLDQELKPVCSSSFLVFLFFPGAKAKALGVSGNQSATPVWHGGLKEAARAKLQHVFFGGPVLMDLHTSVASAVHHGSFGTL